MHPLLETLGGVGLFLYGMTAMTSGLRKLAGDRLRHWLSRWTKTPFSGVIAGAVATAVIQSSSATTVAVVGFVGAGLLTFSQTLGIIFGANIGTTITGWMVALVGFKLKLSAIAVPLLFLAAILYLFKSNRLLRGSGKALAGFCLIFIGLGYLQNGLADYKHAIDFSRWGADHLGSRFLLVVVGGILTLITQSSSATVATALTALNASMLTLPQAAAVIIGADIGTTFTAALATIGGTTMSKRTGFAHVIYNVITGMAAFLILPAYLWGVGQMIPSAPANSPEVVAVSFHTFFNVLGVLLALPFTHQFANLITWLFPERTPTLVALFDRRLLEDTDAAAEALESGTRVLASLAVNMAAGTLSPGPRRHHPHSNESIQFAVEEAREFALRIGGSRDSVFASLHILDHVERLLERSRDEKRAGNAINQAGLASLTNEAREVLDKLAHSLTDTLASSTVERLEALATAMEEDKNGFRTRFMAKAAAGEASATQLDGGLDSHRWLRRLVYHAWRIAEYSLARPDRPAQNANPQPHLTHEPTSTKL